MTKAANSILYMCCPFKCGTSLTLHITRPISIVPLQGKMIKAAKAEALVRRVLSHTPPGLFQHMMRTINSQVCGRG